MSQYLLDTNICIAYLNNKQSKVGKEMSQAYASDIFLSHIVKAELFFGAYHSQIVEENLKTLRLFFHRFKTIPFIDDITETYGILRHNLSSAGKIIGPNDLFIGATALVYDLTLVTNNEREFSRIENLKIENWLK